VRRTLAGEFVCVSRHLLTHLIELGLWNETIKNKLIAHNGSVQNITEIPVAVRELYRTVWELVGGASALVTFICVLCTLHARKSLVATSHTTAGQGID
jgi:hypothetical protein